MSHARDHTQSRSEIREATAVLHGARIVPDSQSNPETRNDSALASNICRESCFDIDYVPHERMQTITASSRTESQSPSEFAYGKINEWQTRLILLQPGSGDDRVQADLVAVDLTMLDGAVLNRQLIQYSALSYCWGSTEKTELILLNELKFAVTANLYAGICALRDVAEPVYLWIDAICIDQSSNEEKSTQVGNMLRIYQKASKVFVWLGDYFDGSELSLKCLELHKDLRERLQHSSSQFHTQKCLQTLQNLHERLLQFYSLPWFRRSWIRQEVYGAKEIEIRFGSNSISRNELVGGFELFGYMEDVLKKSAISFKEFDRIDAGVMNEFAELRHDTTSFKPPRDFADVLTSVQYFQSTVPHDKIYAVLGMCGIQTSSPGHKSVPSSIIIDYQRPLGDVLQDVTTLIINRPATDTERRKAYADLFHYRQCQTMSRASGSAGGPQVASWIMNWEKCCSREEITCIRRVTDERPTMNQRTLTGIPSEGGHEPPPEIHGQTLHLKCRLADIVTELTEWTCDLPLFLEYTTDSALRTPGTKIDLKLMRFDARKHTRRLVYLGCYLEARRAALVPSDVQINDILVHVAWASLPLVLNLRNLDEDTAKQIKKLTKKRHARITTSRPDIADFDSLLQKFTDACVVKGPAFCPAGLILEKGQLRVFDFDALTYAIPFQHITGYKYSKDKLSPLRTFILC